MYLANKIILGNPLLCIVCLPSRLSILFHSLLFSTILFSPGCLVSLHLQGCSSPIVVKFADTQKDKEQRRLQQQLAQQMQQLNSATTWGSLTGLGGLTPQYLAVRAASTASAITCFSFPYFKLNKRGNLKTVISSIVFCLLKNIKFNQTVAVLRGRIHRTVQHQ